MDWVSRFRRSFDEPYALPATPDEAVRRLLDGNARFIHEVAPDLPEVPLSRLEIARARVGSRRQHQRGRLDAGTLHEVVHQPTGVIHLPQ